MRKRSLCVSPSVRPTVRPSVTLVHCTQTAEDIVKLLSRLGSAINLVFFSDSERRTQLLLLLLLLLLLFNERD